MLWGLSSFPRFEPETRLIDFAARPPHVFVLVLRAHLLHEAVAQDVQSLIPYLLKFFNVLKQMYFYYYMFNYLLFY